MSRRIIDGVEFSPTLEDIARRIRLDAYPELEHEVEELLAAARSVAEPRAAYLSGPTRVADSSTVEVCGVHFRSEALAAGIGASPADRAVVYVATCGPELADIDISAYDPLATYWLDVVAERALAAVSRELRAAVRAELGGAPVRHIHPGSAGGDVWPIEDQRFLFALLGDEVTATAERPARSAAGESVADGAVSATPDHTSGCGDAPTVIGVRLTESCLMQPNKSVSGVAFAVASPVQSSSGHLA